MKVKISSILLTVLVIFLMWQNSPMREYAARPTIKVVSAKEENVSDYVVTRGYVEEANKKSIRLDKSAIVENIYVSVGDFVGEGNLILEVTEKDSELSDITAVMGYLPEINDISDITSFYIPKKIDNTTPISPQITAPISGIVTEVAVKEGDVALFQAPIITISDFNALNIRASISELYVKDIKVGQKAELTGEAFEGKTYMATVKEISPIAKQKTSLTGSNDITVDVLLSVVSKDTDLRPGYSVTAKIFTKSHYNATTLPYSCIFQEEDREYVYEFVDGKVNKKAVITGFELEDRVEIVSGIDKNDKIVMDPTNKLHDNMMVKVGE